MTDSELQIEIDAIEAAMNDLRGVLDKLDSFRIMRRAQALMRHPPRTTGICESTAEESAPPVAPRRVPETTIRSLSPRARQHGDDVLSATLR